MYRVIIAGGRDFSNYPYLRSCADKDLAAITDEIQIVSGNARGADSLGERYAQEKGYKLALFPADWERYGRSAGPRRNAQMAENADALIAFWDGQSRGTKNMIDRATEKGLKVTVHNY